MSRLLCPLLVSASPVSVCAPVPGDVVRLVSGWRFVAVRASARSFSAWVCVLWFDSGFRAGVAARLAARLFGIPFCAVRRCGRWWCVSVPCFVGAFVCPVGAVPCVESFWLVVVAVGCWFLLGGMERMQNVECRMQNYYL